MLRGAEEGFQADAEIRAGLEAGQQSELIDEDGAQDVALGGDQSPGGHLTTALDDALETASMDTVEKMLGYAAATSSPFYYRMRAARLFGFLSSKSALSAKAKDYIKPHDEGMQAAILAEAILGIPAYAELVKIHYAKKLNVELLGHWIAKEQKLTDGCALMLTKPVKKRKDN